jgi:hypothetical protein
MITVVVKTDKDASVKKFVFNTKKRMGSPKIHSGLHSGFRLEAFEKQDHVFVCFAYALPGEFILQYLALFFAIPLILFLGLSWWLSIPGFFLVLPWILKLLGWWLLHKGLRKEGYQGKIKLASNNRFIFEVVLNGTE